MIIYDVYNESSINRLALQGICMIVDGTAVCITLELSVQCTVVHLPTADSTFKAQLSSVMYASVFI